MQFYTKDDSGEYTEATDGQIEELFRSRSDKIVAKKLAAAREKAMEELRPELEEQIRKDFIPKLEEEAQKKATEEWQGKLDEANKRADGLDVALRRKTIAAEYGFKPEAEQFLGDGSDDDMRAKADALKSSFNQPEAKYPDKQSTEPVSKLQQETGLKIVV